MQWTCCFLVFLCGKALGAPNLLPNASFEGGKTGWTLWHEDSEKSSGRITRETARVGKYAFQVRNNGTRGANLFSNHVSVLPNTGYTLSVYARTQDVEGVRVALWALDKAGETLCYELPHPSPLPGTQLAWARFRTIVKTPENCAFLKAHLVCNGGTVWWDAIKLEAGREATPFCGGPPLPDEEEQGNQFKNLLPNGDFEDDQMGWSLWRQRPQLCYGEIVDSEGRGGSKAFHVVNQGGGGANLHSDPIACEPNTVYTVSVYAKVKEGRDVFLAGWTQDAAMRENNYAVDEPVPLPESVDALTRFQKTFTTPEDAAFLKAHLICNQGEIWWEDCQIEEGALATRYSPGRRLECLSPRKLPQAREYAKRIIAEGRLWDALRETERLFSYRGKGLEEGRRMRLTREIVQANKMAGEISRALHADALVPDYIHIDYVSVEKRLERAQEEIIKIWRALGADPEGLFEVWNPPALDPAKASLLAEEFLIFPCFTRPYFFEGEGNWDVLEPFGFRMVSGWWHVGYQEDGTLCPWHLERALEQCGAHGYACDTCVPVASALVHALKPKLGNALYTRTSSGAFSPWGNCHDTLNIWHPGVREAVQDFLLKLAARYAPHPGVVSHELINEPSLTVESLIHGYHYEHLGEAGYSQEAREAWKTWLKARYADLSKLNDTWGTDLQNWSKVEPPEDLVPPVPKDSETPVPCGAILDFQTFRAESHADWFKMCVEAMHRGDPVKPVISQYYSPAAERRESGLDLRLMAERVDWDILGTHDWSAGRPAVSSLYVASMNRVSHLPLWEDEYIWSHWEKKGTPESLLRAATERNLWRMVAWGKRGISLFNLDSEWAHDSPNNWNNSMLNIEADLEIPRYCVGVVPTVERKTCLFKDVLYQTRVHGEDVSLLRPTASSLVAGPSHSVREESIYIAGQLLERHFMPLMMPEEHIERGYADLERIRLLVAPWAFYASKKLQERLLDWIEGGGCLFATGPLGLFDPWGRPSGLLLERILGETRWELDVQGDDWRWKAGENETKEELLRFSFGKGTLYLTWTRLEEKSREDLLWEAVKEVLPDPFLRTDLPHLEVVPRVDDRDNLYLFLVNLDPSKELNGTVEVRGAFTEAVELSCQERPRLKLVVRDGYSRVPVLLHPGGGLFVQLLSKQATPSARQ